MSSAFTSKLVTETLDAVELRSLGASRPLFRLREPLVFRSAMLKEEITVPTGFTTDLASIPRFALPYINDDDPAISYPSVVHDWLYTTQSTSRRIADLVLHEAMLVCGARKAQAFVVFLAVRIGGGGHWKS